MKSEEDTRETERSQIKTDEAKETGYQQPTKQNWLYGEEKEEPNTPAKMEREIVRPPTPNYMDDEKDDALFNACVNTVQLWRNGRARPAPPSEACPNQQ